MCIWYLVLYNNQIDILKIIMKVLPFYHETQIKSNLIDFSSDLNYNSKT